MSGTVVITGGCGFLGAALARLIAEKGVALPDGRRIRPAIQLWDREGVPVPTIAGATFHEMDVADAAAVAAAMPRDVVLVYHLAAIVSGQAEADYDLAMRVNLGGTNAVLAATRAVRDGVPLIGTSSLAV